MFFFPFIQVLNFEMSVDEDALKSARFEHNLMLPVTPQDVFLTFKPTTIDIPG